MKKFFERNNRIFVLIFILVIVNLMFYFDFFDSLTFENLKLSQEVYGKYYDESPFVVLFLFFVIYVLVVALSIPGATVLTLAAGALFGLVVGVVLVSFASAIGATLAMLLSRLFFSGFVERRFGKYVKKINKGVEEEGAFYLFSLRLVPLFPFFVVNLVFGLTKIRTWTFFWVSQVGMFLGTIVYVNAGVRLSELDSLVGILSWELILSFVLIGLLPIVSKKILDIYNSRKVGLKD